MKLLNTANRRKEVGYAIRRDTKESYAKECERKYGVFVRSFDYLIPGHKPRFCDSASWGVEHVSTCMELLAWHLAEFPDLAEMWDYSIVKITCIEEKVG
jgi:hypothetical protein